MTETLTPEAVKAAQDMADLLDAWGEVSRYGQSKDMAVAAFAMRDLATAYLAQAGEIERLRKRVEAGDRLARWCEAAISDPVSATDVCKALAAYRALQENPDDHTD